MLTASVLLCALMFLTRVSEQKKEKRPVPGAVSPPPAAAAAWSDFNGRSYSFVPENLTWAQAEKNCLTMKANLASVHSAEEYGFIQNLVESATKGSPRVWIGGSDCQENNVWLWSDGTAFLFRMWSPGQPDNLRGLQSCVQINHGVTMGWDDTGCSNHRPSVCAKTL